MNRVPRRRFARLASRAWQAGDPASARIYLRQAGVASRFARHAPRGGVTIAGVFYPGGRFIPDAALSQATPAERTRIDAPLAEGRRRPHHHPDQADLFDWAALVAPPPAEPAPAPAAGPEPDGPRPGDRHEPQPRGGIAPWAYQFEVTAIDGDRVTVREGHGLARGKTFTLSRADYARFADDLYGRVRVPPTSGNPYVDAVARGEGELLGKGDDGIVFRVGDRTVKADTVVGFVPFNHPPRPADEAVDLLVAGGDAARTLADAGVPGVLAPETVRHAGRAFEVRPYVELPETLTAGQLRQVHDTIDAMHAAGWALNDDVQVGLLGGRPVLFDVGKAARLPDDHRRADDARDMDLTRLEGLYQRNGVPFDDSTGFAVERAWRWATGGFDDPESRATADTLWPKLLAHHARTLHGDARDRADEAAAAAYRETFGADPPPPPPPDPRPAFTAACAAGDRATADRLYTDLEAALNHHLQPAGAMDLESPLVKGQLRRARWAYRDAFGGFPGSEPGLSRTPAYEPPDRPLPLAAAPKARRGGRYSLPEVAEIRGGFRDLPPAVAFRDEASRWREQMRRTLVDPTRFEELFPSGSDQDPQSQLAAALDHLWTETNPGRFYLSWEKPENRTPASLDALYARFTDTLTAGRDYLRASSAPWLYDARTPPQELVDYARQSGIWRMEKLVRQVLAKVHRLHIPDRARDGVPGWYEVASGKATLDDWRQADEAQDAAANARSARWQAERRDAARRLDAFLAGELAGGKPPHLPTLSRRLAAAFPGARFHRGHNGRGPLQIDTPGGRFFVGNRIGRANELAALVRSVRAAADGRDTSDYEIADAVARDPSLAAAFADRRPEPDAAALDAARAARAAARRESARQELLPGDIWKLSLPELVDRVLQGRFDATVPTWGQRPPARLSELAGFVRNDDNPQHRGLALLDLQRAVGRLHFDQVDAAARAGERVPRGVLAEYDLILTDGQPYGADAVDAVDPPSHAYLRQARRALAAGDRTGARVYLRRAIRYGARRAPKGGVTIAGTFYPGGRFIPGEVLAGATAAERAAVEGRRRIKDAPGQGDLFGGPPATPPPAAPAAAKTLRRLETGRTPPVPPFADFTGTDTLGRVWEDGRYVGDTPDDPPPAAGPLDLAGLHGGDGGPLPTMTASQRGLLRQLFSSHLMESQQPPADRILPVVGVLAVLDVVTLSHVADFAALERAGLIAYAPDGDRFRPVRLTPAGRVAYFRAAHAARLDGDRLPPPPQAPEAWVDLLDTATVLGQTPLGGELRRRLAAALAAPADDAATLRTAVGRALGLTTARRRTRAAPRLRDAVNRLATDRLVDYQLVAREMELIGQARQLQTRLDQLRGDSSVDGVNEQIRLRGELSRVALEGKRVQEEHRGRVLRARAAVRALVDELVGDGPRIKVTAAPAAGTGYSPPQREALAAGAAFIDGLAAGTELSGAVDTDFTDDPMGVCSPDRAAWLSVARRIFVPARYSPPSAAAAAVHELGHALEDADPGIHAAAVDFLHERIAGCERRAMNDWMPAGYRDDEVGAADEFHLAFGDSAAYVGKLYPGDAATEIVAMGLEELYNDPGRLAYRDPGYCAFLLGLLAGDTRVPTAELTARRQMRGMFA